MKLLISLTIFICLVSINCLAKIDLLLTDKEPAGKYNINALHNISYELFNNYFSVQSKPTFLNQSLYLSKSLLFDFPLAYYLMVLNHEYYGHYATFKNINNVEPEDFHVDLPPPYGKGRGYAVYSYIPSQLSNDEALWINYSGMMTNLNLSHNIIKDNYITDQLNNNDFLLYVLSLYDHVVYTLISDENNQGDDISNYINVLENKYNRNIDLKDLQKSVQFSMLNPIVMLSIYQNLFNNRQFMSNYEIPKFKINNTDYLPIPSTEFTPFGLQYRIDHYIETDILHILTTSYGNNDIETFWQLGYELNKLNFNSFSIMPKLSIWNQPGLTINQKTYDSGFGFSLSLRSNILLKEINNSYFKKISLLNETGYKSSGFLLAEHLAEDFYVRFGISII